MSASGQSYAGVGVDSAFDGAGNAWAIWWASTDGTHYHAEVAELPAGTAAWGTSTLLSDPAQDAETPRIAVDAQGDVLAVWVLYNRIDSGIVQAAWRPAASGKWEAPVNLSPAGRIMYEPAIAMDPDGDATVLWDGSNGTFGAVQAAARPAATGAWTVPVDLSLPGGNVSTPHVTMDRHGNAVATWTTNATVQSSYRPAAAGVWQPPVDINAAGWSAQIGSDVAFDAGGNALAVWSAGEEGPNSYMNYPVIRAARRSAATGLWGPASSLSVSNVPTGDLESGTPDVAFDAQGDAIVAWVHNEDFHVAIQTAVLRAAGSAWSAPVDISVVDRSGPIPQPPSEPHVAADPQGNAMVIWRQGVWDRWHDIQTAWLAAGTSTWGAPISHSAAEEYGETPEVSFDARGNALAVWMRSAEAGNNCGCWLPVADTYDIAPRTVVTPSTVTAVATPPATVRVAPRILSARLTRRRFRAAGLRHSSKTSAVGTVIRVTLSADAKLEVVFRRKLAGRFVKGRGCIAQPARARRARTPACTALRRVGTVTRALARQGATTIAFNGRLSAHALQPGSYLATLTPSIQGRSGEAKRLSFTVVP